MMLYITLHVQVIDAIALIEDSMEKLQLYADDLLEIAKSHFPEVSRKLPKLLTRDYGKYENAVNKATENEVSHCCILIISTQQKITGTQATRLGPL